MEQLEGGWPERVLTMQRNWIGRSEGAFVDFAAIEGSGDEDRKSPSSPPGPTRCTAPRFLVVAPEARWRAEIVTDDQRAEFEAYLEKTKQATEIERQSTDRAKTGVFLGVYAINPVNGERIPVWAADYVLADYGTGAVMAVPAHDQRDLDFARTFGLPVRVGGRHRGRTTGRDRDGHHGRRPYVNSRLCWTGCPTRRPASRRSSTRLEDEGAGRARVDLPAARLAAEPAALLGLPDPDHPLRDVWGGAGAR